ncbi:MAG: hypothetical protein ABGW81_06910, partial [Paracoccaceae bacterium]
MAKKPRPVLRATRPQSGKARKKPVKAKPSERGSIARVFGWLCRTMFRVVWWVGLRAAILGSLGM